MGETPNDSLGFQLVDESLNCLTREAHRAGDLRNSARFVGESERAEHLPSGGGEPCAHTQRIAGSDERAIQSKDLEYNLCERLTRIDRRGLSAARLWAAGGSHAGNMSAY
jgi:hypothetical protein